MGVSKTNGIPKSSILIGFSVINHPFWGTPIFGNTHIPFEGPQMCWLPSRKRVHIISHLPKKPPLEGDIMSVTPGGDKKHSGINSHSWLGNPPWMSRCISYATWVGFPFAMFSFQEGIIYASHLCAINLRAFHWQLIDEVLVAGNCRFLCTAQGEECGSWDGHLSNEKRAPGCLGDVLGMKSYPVMGGLVHEPLQGSLLTNQYNGK